MNNQVAASAETGVTMADLETRHGRFIPAAQVLRARPLTASLPELAWQHVKSSKRSSIAQSDFAHVGQLARLLAALDI
jgi:hypothetical protein